MPVTYHSRTGKIYYLHSGPKRGGGVQHFFSTKADGRLAKLATRYMTHLGKDSFFELF